MPRTVRKRATNLKARHAAVPVVLPIALNPYFDDILRRHVVRAARDHGVPLEELERAFDSEADAISFLRRSGREYYEAYVEEADEAVDHHGWVVVDRSGRALA